LEACLGVEVVDVGVGELEGDDPMTGFSGSGGQGWGVAVVLALYRLREGWGIP
jgi:hypothetical protein